MKRLIDYVKQLFTRKAATPVVKAARKPRVKKEVAPCCGPTAKPKKGITVPKKGK
jgi:hypothetical protein